MEPKAEVRRRHRAQRAALSRAEIAARAQRLAAVLGEQIGAESVVVGYMPMRGEPDVLPLLGEHIRRGGRVFVPVIIDAGTRRLAWAQWTSTVQLRRSTLFPVMEPVGVRTTTTELLQLAAHTGLTVLVPALAVDAAGARLGQGGGFYDTLFAEHSELVQRAELLAVLHAEEVLRPGSFAVEDHDLRVHRAVTPEGMITLSGEHDESV
ncbi:5-formyltetrahydrofolate cyclo-ligase [Garicola koreensis]|uniref:5-formyltetrahydrofolate cyclo-ligase n=1 Tax=Garicola koreensis TaxID=1262554 RepID=A0A7W5XND8_9MICC|nr:5-formyltetrahydrofolate cyclo-ligase [Garicola koreensis]